MKAALDFYVLDCEIPCVLGIPFLGTVNPSVDWVNREVRVYTTKGHSPLTVVSGDSTAVCDIVSGK